MTQELAKVMTHAEFSKGWLLLVIQPWGYKYNQVDKQGKPTIEAKTQLEFYYDKLKWADPRAWLKVAEVYAQGKEWPSIGELKPALQQVNAQFVKTGTTKAVGEGMPAEVREMIQRIADKASFPKANLRVVGRDDVD